jgi:hypothetical protein
MKHLIAIMFLYLLVTSGSVQGRDHDNPTSVITSPNAEKPPGMGGTEADNSTAPKQSSKSYLNSTEIYVGERKYGKPHGQGTFTFSNGSKYVGGFKKGKMHGQGTFTYGDRGKYVGFWMYPLDDIVERFPHGTMYSGDWKNGKYGGQGTITFPDGSMYVGTFKGGEYHGHGTFTNAVGRKFVGEFKDGAYLGQDAILSPAYYRFFGDLRPVAESIVIKIRSGHRWTCSVDTAENVNGKPQERKIQTVFNSTYRDDSGIKWYKELIIEMAKLGIVIDAGQHGTEIKDVAGGNDDVLLGSTLGKYLVEELLKRFSKEQLIEFFSGSVGPLIGMPMQQDMFFRLAPNTYSNLFALGFDRTPLDVTSLGATSGKSVVVGETTVDSSRKLVLGLVANMDMTFSLLDGAKIILKGSVVGYQLIDLDSGLPTDSQTKMIGFAKRQNLKVKLKNVQKRLCKK